MNMKMRLMMSALCAFCMCSCIHTKEEFKSDNAWKKRQEQSFQEKHFLTPKEYLDQSTTRTDYAHDTQRLLPFKYPSMAEASSRKNLDGRNEKKAVMDSTLKEYKAIQEQRK